MTTAVAKRETTSDPQSEENAVADLREAELFGYDSDIQEKFVDFHKAVSDSMVERDGEVLIILLALLCNEHCLFVGPPGTGKSEMARKAAALLNAAIFDRLLTKHTNPNEIMGPLKISQLKKDIYEYQTKGYAAEAEVLFLDEIFKSSSALLNTLLTLLNERVFYSGLNMIQCPLKICIAASNEWPGEGATGQELSALFDRFMFRKMVRPIASEKNMEKLLFGNLPTPSITPITVQELESAQQAVKTIKWDKSALDTFTQIRRQLRSEGIVVGDRRMKKAVTACQAMAYMAGTATVEPEHLCVLTDILWVDPAEQPAKVSKIVLQLAAPATLEVNGYLAEAEEVFESVKAGEVGTMTSAVKKLDEIKRKLKGLKGDAAEQAMKHVASLASDVKRTALEEIDQD